MATLKLINDTGLTLYAILRDADLLLWNTDGEEMEAYNSENYADYVIEATKQGDTGLYYVVTPAGLPVGIYSADWRLQAGVDPADSDSCVGLHSAYWDAANWFPDWAIKLVESASPVTNSPEAKIAATKTAAEGAATPGAEMALTDAQVTALLASLEADLIDDELHEAVMAAIVAKLEAGFPDLDTLTLVAIASQVRTELTTELARIDAVISSRGTSTLDAAGVRAAVGMDSANLDTQLGDIPTVAEFEARTIVAADYFDPAADEVTPTTASKTGYALSAAERNLVATALLDLADGVETDVTLRQALQRVAAVLSGKISGAGTGSETFVGLDGATDRVEVTVDSSGNRTAVEYDP